MPNILTHLRIDEVSAVIKGANPGAKVLIRKSDDAGPLSFNEAMLRKLSEENDDISDENMIDPNDTPTSLLPKLNDMVLAMVRAEPSLSEEHALFYILHHPHGRKLAEHLNNLSKGETMPQVDIMKAISVMEDVLRRRSGSAMAKAMPSLSAENSRTTSISGNSGATLQKPSTLWRWARAWQL